MKNSTTRLQTLLHMVKTITVRPSKSDEREREPWEVAPSKMEQLELSFEPRNSRPTAVAGG